MSAFFRTTFVLVAIASTVLSMPQPIPSATHVSNSRSALASTHTATATPKAFPKAAFVAASPSSKTSSKVGFASTKATSSAKPKASTAAPIIPPLIIPTADQDGPDAHVLNVGHAIKRTVEVLRDVESSFVEPLKGRDFLGLRSGLGHISMKIRGTSNPLASKSSLPPLVIPVARAHVLKTEIAAENEQQVE